MMFIKVNKSSKRDIESKIRIHVIMDTKIPCINALYELSYSSEPIYLDIIEFVPCPIEFPNVEINNKIGADAPTANAPVMLN